ncbi:MAG: PIN domain-containing protein [Chloroflexi bacterium]|nr:PIN domain-containing protein [Chloroflexota bacterium]
MTSTPVPTAIVDTNVLHPAGMRDILLRVAKTDLYRLKWSQDIRSELIRTIHKVRPDLDHAQFERHTLALMDEFFRDGFVTGYETRVDDLEGIDAKDRHVAAAAIQGACSVILTNNLRHFPADVLAPHGITAQKPDDFLVPILLMNPDKFCEAARQHRVSLTKPPYNVEAYLTKLARDGINRTATELSYFAYLLD